MTSKSKLDEIIQKYFSFDQLDELLCVNLANETYNKYDFNGYCNEIRSYFTELTQEPLQQQDQQNNDTKKEAINHLVSFLYQQKHAKKQLILFRLINKLISNQSIETKLVCESMLANLVKYYNESTSSTYIWCKSFEYIKKFIHKLDYKSCRDVFKALLDVVKHLSNKNNSKLPDSSVSTYESTNILQDSRIEALYDTIRLLLDRETYFLPGYLAINEIKSVLKKEPYHERFHSLFSQFTESFVPIAHLLSVVSRDCLLPVVGFSNLYSTHTVWKFHSISCKFIPNGPLPYYKVQHISKIQHDLFAYILRQNISHTLILNLFGQTSKFKQRVLALEDELVYTLIDTMKKTTDLSNVPEQYRIWNNLANSLINSILSSNIHMPSILEQLLNKLKNEKFNMDKSRDWLMWCFFQVLSTTRNIPKNQQATKSNLENDFAGVLDLFDLLYRNDDDFIQEQLDYNDFTSVIKLSVLSIWFTLVKKQDNRIILPSKLNKHLNLLEDIVQNQIRDDYALAIWLNAYYSENDLFKKPMIFLCEKIGQPLSQPMGQNLATIHLNCNHQNAVSTQMIHALSANLKLQAINLITIHLSLKQVNKNPNTIQYMTPTMVESYVRLCNQDGGIFMQLFQQLWNGLMNAQNVANLAMNAYYHQHVNLVLEIIAFRITNFSFTTRITFLTIINSLFNEQNDRVNLLKYPQIYINCQCALLKLLQGFSGADLYELLTSIYGNPKYASGFLINPELDEINKVSTMLIARAIKLTSNDLNPNYENKEREDKIRELLAKILDKTPIYFSESTLNSFPEFMATYLREAKGKYMLNETSISKTYLEIQVQADYDKLKECQYERQVFDLFANDHNTYLCVLFKCIEDDSNCKRQTYLNLLLNFMNSSLESRKMPQLMRVFCDFLIVSGSKNDQDIDNALNQLQKMFHYNIFTFDRFLFVLMLRSYEDQDMIYVFQLLNCLVIKFHEYEQRIMTFHNFWNEFCSNDEWNPNVQTRYLINFPDKFNYDELRHQLGHQIRENYLLAYYGNIYTRLISIMDIFFYSYFETSACNSDVCVDLFALLFKHHPNPIAYTYTTLMYYQDKSDVESILKKKRLVLMLVQNIKPESPIFTNRFKEYLQSQYETGDMFDMFYYQELIEILVKRMLDKDDAYFELKKIEFNNPSCYILNLILIELMSLSLFVENFDESSICRNIINYFLTNFVQDQNLIDKEIVYLINASGLIMAHLPETCTHYIYDYLENILNNNDILNDATSVGSHMDLLNYFDIYMLNEHGLDNNEVTLVISLFHSFLYHSNANHFQHFVKFIKESLKKCVKSETHFLFICKLIGPFLSKIHSENSNLLIDLVNQLYDMVVIIDNTTETLIYQDTIVNFFYHLKYRHTGESIKEKVNDIMPKLKPALRKRFKYIIPELNHQ